MLDIKDLAAAARCGIEWPDIYFSPGYGAATAALDGGEWQLAVWNQGEIICPYVLRPIPAELCGSDKAYDIISPYGYSGTALNAVASVDSFLAFRAAFEASLADMGVVAEFQRQSSFVRGGKSMATALTADRLQHCANTLVVPVNDGYESAWAAYEGRARTKARKARKLGYQWSCKPVTTARCPDFISFRQLYENTMRRIGAKEYYFFSADFYERLCEGVGDCMYLYQVLDAQGAIKSSGLLFAWEQYIHLYLVGSDPEALKDGVGNLAYDGLIEWACQRPDARWVNIGGGVDGEDALYKFKRSFGGQCLPFHTFSNVINPSEFQRLAERRAQAVGMPVSELLALSYFPQYRAG